jgi:hypothetical protein
LSVMKALSEHAFTKMRRDASEAAQPAAGRPVT